VEKAFSSGSGAEELQKWCLMQNSDASTALGVAQLTQVQLHRQQTYLDVICKVGVVFSLVFVYICCVFVCFLCIVDSFC
jgi:hypothetical protein